MEDSSGTSDKLTLRREVEPPQRHHTGLSVMLITSAAMFLAVASSALILRAHIPRGTCVRARVVKRVPPPVTAVKAQDQKDCGEAVYRNNPDGSVSVHFNLCRTNAATTIDLPAGVHRR